MFTIVSEKAEYNKDTSNYSGSNKLNVNISLSHNNLQVIGVHDRKIKLCLLP